MTTTTDPAIAAFLMSEDDLKLSAGLLPGYDPTDPICGACGERETHGVVFGIVAAGVVGRLCGECAEQTGPLGAALVGLVDGLEAIAAAVAEPVDRRTDLLTLAAKALRWVSDAAEAGAGRG